MNESATTEYNGITRELGSDGASRWVWLKNASGRDLAGVSQDTDSVTLAMAEPKLTWANQWKMVSGEASIADTEQMAEALRQAIELAREWTKDTGKPIKDVLK